MDYRHNCTAENAPRFLDWIRNRQGIAVWRSLDLSDPSFSLSTPVLDPEGNPVTKPHWKVGSAPDFIVTNPDEIEVHLDHEVKRFHVAVRLGSNGMKLKCTPGATRRIEAAVATAGPGAYHVFDYETQEAVIMAPEKTQSLTEWAAANL